MLLLIIYSSYRNHIYVWVSFIIVKKYVLIVDQVSGWTGVNYGSDQALIFSINLTVSVLIS